MITAVLVGAHRRDGEEHTLAELLPVLRTPRREDIFGVNTGLDGALDDSITIDYWRLALASDGQPRRDERGRYRYELMR